MAKIITEIPSISNIGVPEAPIDGIQYGREDATWTPINDISYTDEQAQDTIGTILLDTITIDLSYNDVTPSISADVKPNSIDATHLSNSINVSEFVNDSDYATEAYVDSKIPVDYSKVVYVDSNNPNTATIFDSNNPPTVNDDTLKTDVNNLYVGLNASTWVYNSTSLTYITEPITSGTSNFYLGGTLIDAGGNKITAIERTGTVGGAPGTLSHHFVTKAQHDLKENSSNKTGTVAGNEASTSLYLHIAGMIAYFQQKLTSGTNLKTVNGSTLLGSGNLVTPDMTTSTAQTVSGVKTFLAGMFGLRNTANTFTSFFASAVTASRTWTWPDKSGTIAMTSDIVSQLSGVVNYVVKFGTSTTGIISRLFDDGTNFGIGTVRNPTKDITLRRGNREIGVENSDNSSKGGDIIISAGNTINTATLLLEPLFTTSKQWFHMAVAPNGDIYATEYNGGKIWKRAGGLGDFIDTGNTGGLGITVDISGNVYKCINNQSIWKQTGGTGSFVNLSQAGRNWWGMGSSLINNNVYACVSGGDIYMQTSGAGNFNPLGQASRVWQAVTGHPNGNIYAIVYNGDIYMQTAGTGNFNPLSQTSRTWTSIYCAPSGNVYATVNSGDIYMQTAGTGNFVATGQTSRVYGGICIDANNNIYAAEGYGSTSGYIYYAAAGTGPADLDGGLVKIQAGLAKGIGKSRTETWTGQKTTSGTNIQILVLRDRFDEDGNYTRFGTPVYADNIAALAGGLTAGMEYRTATGIKMEVY